MTDTSDWADYKLTTGKHTDARLGIVAKHDAGYVFYMLSQPGFRSNQPSEYRMFELAAQHLIALDLAGTEELKFPFLGMPELLKQARLDKRLRNRHGRQTIGDLQQQEKLRKLNAKRYAEELIAARKAAKANQTTPTEEPPIA